MIQQIQMCLNKLIRSIKYNNNIGAENIGSLKQRK